MLLINYFFFFFCNVCNDQEELVWLWLTPHATLALANQSVKSSFKMIGCDGHERPHHKKIRANSIHAQAIPSCFSLLFFILKISFNLGNDIIFPKDSLLIQDFIMVAASGAVGFTLQLNNFLGGLCFAFCFWFIWLRVLGQTCTFWGMRFGSLRSSSRKGRRNGFYWRKKWAERRKPERRYLHFIWRRTWPLRPNS